MRVETDEQPSTMTVTVTVTASGAAETSNPQQNNHVNTQEPSQDAQEPSQQAPDHEDSGEEIDEEDLNNLVSRIYSN